MSRFILDIVAGAFGFLLLIVISIVMLVGIEEVIRWL